MTLQLKTKTELFDLHCSVGLTDWDMDKELKLATTTDQFFHGVNEGCHSRPKCALGYLGHFMFHCLSLMTDDKLNEQYVIQRPSARASRRKDDFIWYDKTSDTFVKPNLWLLVNPDIACPIQCEPSTEVLQTPHEPTDEIQRPLLKPAENQHPPSRQRRMFAPHHVSVKEALLHPVSTTTKRLRNKEDVSCRPAKNRRKGRTTKARESKNLKPGCWPRPPVNYCILIALALKSSHTGSLKVQQIYNFTREHFPFFQTAPDGWKNTIRHNLCFSNSFCKTCNQLCRDGKRKSCFWHLTMDGHRRLKDEIRALAGDSLKQLERSMSRPDIIWSLLAL